MYFRRREGRVSLVVFCRWRGDLEGRGGFCGIEFRVWIFGGREEVFLFCGVSFGTIVWGDFKVKFFSVRLS